MRLTLATRLLTIVCLLALLSAGSGVYLIRSVEDAQNKTALETSKHTALEHVFKLTHGLHNYIEWRDQVAAKSLEAESSDDNSQEDSGAAEALPEAAPTQILTTINNALTGLAKIKPSLSASADYKAIASLFAELSEIAATPQALQTATLHTLESAAVTLFQTEEIGSSYNLLGNMALFIVLMSMLAPVCMLMTVRHYITKPLTLLQDRLYTLTNNDYETPVPCIDRRDELGNMAFSIDVLRAAHQRVHEVEASRLHEAEARAAHKEKLEAVIHHFRDSVGKVIDAVGVASGQLTSASERILSSVDNANRHAHEIDVSVEQTTKGVQDAANHTNATYEAVNEIAKISNKSNKLSNEMAKEVETSLQTVTELSDATQSISGVTHLIRKITERINLLALNAGIESARAGEAGKGFVVVAQEVKILAAQTKKATEEIIDHISVLQERSEAALEALDAVKTRVVSIQEGNAAGQSIVESQRKVVNGLIYSMKDASGAMRSMEQSIHTVKESVDNVQVLSRSVAETGRTLNANANILTQEVRKFLHEIEKEENA